MFQFFKKKIKAPSTSQDQEYKFTWYEIGEGNPFNKRILDIRSLTQHVLSFTKDKSVAELFNKQRQSIGEELIDAIIPASEIIEVNLIYPHNGSKIEGTAYKARCMEDKWDIYGWDNIIYFTRSWTGEIIYKAYIKINDDNFSIYKVEYRPDEYIGHDKSLVTNNVHFLIKTLAFGEIYPHKIPANLVIDKEIALYSFSQFGRNSWYATYDNIIDTIKQVQT